jgi:hypothetical protein
MRQFIDYLNSFVEAPGFEFPFAVNLGFVKVPKVSAHEPIARDIIAQVRANASQKGRHEFAGDLGELFLQYLVADREEQPPFSGGAVANERGVPDYYETALRRIAEKRDMSDSSSPRPRIPCSVRIGLKDCSRPTSSSASLTASLRFARAASSAFNVSPRKLSDKVL